MNFFPNKSDKESNTNKEKEYNNNTTLDNKKKDSPKESYNDIFEWENIEEKSKDPIEGKMNIDETNKNSNILATKTPIKNGSENVYENNNKIVNINNLKDNDIKKNLQLLFNQQTDKL